MSVAWDRNGFTSKFRWQAMEEKISRYMYVSLLIGLVDLFTNLMSSRLGVVSLAAVFSVVTQRSSPHAPGEERCVTTLKTNSVMPALKRTRLTASA